MRCAREADCIDEGARKGESDTLGNDFGYTDPEESTTDSAVMNYSRRNVKLIAYNTAVRDAIPRIRRYVETTYRLIPKAIPATPKYMHTRTHALLIYRFVYRAQNRYVTINHL